MIAALDRTCAWSAAPISLPESDIAQAPSGHECLGELMRTARQRRQKRSRRRRNLHGRYGKLPK